MFLDPETLMTTRRPHPSSPVLPLLAALGLAAAAPAAAPAQQAPDPGPAPLTAHTLRLDSAATPAAASLADAAWLVGAWDGDGLGGRIQEVWGAPAAGRMIGTFTSLGDDGARFHEIMALVEVDGSLELWVKHFDADFTAWEEKPDYVRFRLVEKEAGVLRFHGLTLERIDDHRMRAYLAMRRGGELGEEVLEYRRAP